ncbi:MAG: hypothetical protein M3Z04_05020 [Chloroflexota bacterium]|nr:hypothetical protein [Chloroflexota bacterium]
MALFAHSLWGPLFIGSVLRLLGLDRLSYWFDEIASLILSRPPLRVILSFTDDQIFHPPLYYALLHYWIIPNEAAIWTRLFSALTGIATIPLVYALGYLLFSRQVGWMSSWLFALSPWHIWYSQETRMYALVCLWATLALLLGIRWDRTPRWSTGVAYVAATLLGLYTNYTMFGIWLPAALLLPLWQRGTWTWGTLLRWLGLQALVVLGYGPQLIYIPTIVAGLYNSDRFGANVGTVGSNLPYILGCLLLAGLLVLVGWITMRHWSSERMRQIAVGGLLVVLFLSLIIMLNPSATLLKRLFSIYTPSICWGGAWAITQARVPALQFRYWVLVSALAAALMLAIVPKEPWREIVGRLDSLAQSGDLVVIEPAYNTLAFTYYDHSNLPLQGVNSQELTPIFMQRIEQSRRVWLILSSEDRIDLHRQVRSWFAARYHPALDWEYYQITVQRYDVGGP